MTLLFSATGTARVTSLANARMHYYARAKIARAQRNSARTILAIAAARSGLRETRDWPPLTIVLTRLGPRLLDDDNLASSFKSFRDGVADFFGVDDGDTSRIVFRYAQERGDGGYRIDVLA